MVQSNWIAYETSSVVTPVFPGKPQVIAAGCGNRSPPPSPAAVQVIWFSAPGPMPTDFV